MNQLSRRITNSLFSLECFVCLGRQENSIRWMTNETEIDTIVIDKVMKFGDLLFCDCCYIGICLLYSPRVWRWSYGYPAHVIYEKVFSTCVEVILICNPLGSNFVRILHVCGGDPRMDRSEFQHRQYSPRVWRWSQAKTDHHYNQSVFSTCVEVIPIISNVSFTT